MEEKLADVRFGVLKQLPVLKHDTPWKEITTSDPAKQHIQLFEATALTGTYMLRLSATTSKCSIEQLVKLNTDNDFETRKQWETGELAGIQEIDHYPDTKLKLIRYWINIPVWLVQDREFFGIQSYQVDEDTGTHTLIFQSIKSDKLMPCDASKYVRGECMSLMQIHKCKEKKEQVNVSIYTYVKPCGLIPEWILPLWKEKLRDRFLLYERVCSEEYDKIYSKKEI